MNENTATKIATDTNNNSKLLRSITAKDIHTTIRESIAGWFGPVGSGQTPDLNVRLYDEEYYFAMIKCPTRAHHLIRALLTLLNSLCIQKKRNSFAVTASVLAVNGSSRTAKISALHFLHRSANDRIKIRQRQLTSSTNGEVVGCGAGTNKDGRGPNGSKKRRRIEKLQDDDEGSIKKQFRKDLLELNTDLNGRIQNIHNV
eukprot:CAMPEP_0194439546 /NCGR_PEP_ID=MMETSP0176-20130528/111160_1 /TAXON_ID=216777 /ORGANISM="Proboscia alata, Strain PI-D3" /LENGTH=200 /DNA_ID=CAMNT_0039262869 /DNA_START=184 /DNA_END=782 /DNA_ORIENTATION=-